MSLSETTRNLLSENQIRINKRLGQNFLIDPGVLGRIIDASELNIKDVVLEIGTGLGTLTKELAQKVKKVITLDVDNKLLQVTINCLKEYSNIKFVESSILDYKIPKIINKIVANLPYYITTPVIAKLLETAKFDLIVLTIQAEVAERIVAKPGGKDYSSFSVFVQAKAEANVHSYAPKSAFFPQPEVSSAVLVLKPYKKPTYEINFDLVRAAFGQRRKTLRNSLKTFNVDFEKAGIDPTRRAETLSLEEWQRFSQIIQKPE